MGRDDHVFAGPNPKGRRGTEGSEDGRRPARPLPQVGDQGCEVVRIREQVGPKGPRHRVHGVNRGALDEEAVPKGALGAYFKL